MAAPRPPYRPSSPGVLLHAPSPDHSPPNLLTDEELAQSIESLTVKLRSAERNLAAVYMAWAGVSVVLLVVGLILLWYGPTVFLDRVLGVTDSNNTLVMAFWWIAVVAVAVFGGAMGDQVLRRKLRLARNWRHRVDELTMRLRDAESVKQRRAGGKAIQE